MAKKPDKPADDFEPMMVELVGPRELDEKRAAKLADACERLSNFVRKGYKLPAYLERALLRMLDQDERHVELITIVNSVRTFAREGHPVSQNPAQGRMGAFEMASKLHNISPANVEKLYYRVMNGNLRAFPAIPKTRKK